MNEEVKKNVGTEIVAAPEGPLEYAVEGVLQWPAPAELVHTGSRSTVVARARSGYDLSNTYDDEGPDGPPFGEGDLPGSRIVPHMMDYGKAAEAERLRCLRAGPRHGSLDDGHELTPPAHETPWAYYENDYQRARRVVGGAMREPRTIWCGFGHPEGGVW